MTYVTVIFHPTDESDPPCPIDLQLMTAVPRIGDHIWFISPARGEWIVTMVTWLLREESLGDVATLTIAPPAATEAWVNVRPLSRNSAQE